MHVLILYNEVAANAGEDERDVLTQVAAVHEHLSAAGHEVRELACSLELAQLDHNLARERPDVVFNLVEALGGTDRLAPLAAALLEARGIPFTGSSAVALQLTNDKLRAKRWFQRAGLPTPPWFTAQTLRGDALPRGAPSRFILKAIHEHASFGMDDQAVVSADNTDSLLSSLQSFERRWAREVFAEQFIDGREFNLALLASEAGVEVLPPAEIEFAGYPSDKPRIVGYQAKWASDSFEYTATPRRFDFPPSDADLLAELAVLACRCWELFEMRGYARVDFRVDDDGRPWILEVNANPCLSPDAGYAAALARAGVGLGDALLRILADTGE